MLFSKKTREYNSYEKDIMFNLEILKYWLIALLVINFITYVFSSNKIALLTISNLVICISSILGLLGANGYMTPIVPLLPVLLLRGSQVFMYVMRGDEYSFNIPLFIICSVAELGFCIFLMLDRNMYVYVEEDEIMEDE